MASSTALYDITVKDNRGNDVNLGAYKGKVLLLVNVASYCGLTTTNYTELSEIYTKYKDDGLEILAFPCNQFSAEEPGTNEEIRNFVCTKFNVEFPIFDKIDVNGEEASPLYKLLKTLKGGDDIEWNFAKFLVDRDGEVVGRYAPTTPPSEVEKDIKEMLSKKY